MNKPLLLLLLLSNISAKFKSVQPKKIICPFLPSMNLKSDLGLTGNLVMMEIPDWSKYGATKSTTSALSDVIVIPAMAILISPLTKSPKKIMTITY